jgi:hypothetical protein
MRGAFHWWKFIGDGPRFRVVTLSDGCPPRSFMVHDADALALCDFMHVLVLPQAR